MEIEETLREFIVSELAAGKPVDGLDGGFSLIENGILDSLGIMKLIQFIEEEFSLPVNDEDVLPENFENLDRIAGFVKRCVSGKA
jgi:acyl carrier protein